ncbi:hypothetical protein [Sphingobium cloacae]|nr:hypothetical protein [Sphingobium cloacae]
MSSTNCMAMGSGMVHCNTMDMGGASQSDDGYALGQGIGALIARGRENSFRKKVGQMLANGDCEGAARFALEKGRLELGADIAKSCKPAPPMASAYINKPPAGGSAAQPASISSAQLESYLRNTAASIQTPVAIDDVTTVSRVEAIGSQLLLTANISKEGMGFTEDQRIRLVNNICAFDGSQPLMQAGASIRIVYIGKDGRQIGSAMATRQQCGF